MFKISLNFDALLKSVSHAVTDSPAQVEVGIDVLTGLSYERTQFSKSAWMMTEHFLFYDAPEKEIQRRQIR